MLSASRSTGADPASLLSPDHRYAPSDPELAILVPAISRFFASGFRSRERIFVIQEAIQSLSPLASHWTSRTVRHWFTNNQTKYISPPMVEKPADFPVMRPVPPQFAMLTSRVNILEQQVKAIVARPDPAEGRDRSRGYLADRLALFIGQSTVPISIIESQAFRSLISDLSSDSSLPCRATVRSRLIQLANTFRSSLTPETEQSRFVSLMVDGVRAGGQNWLGLCLATAKCFYFWRVIAIENQQAVTIAGKLSQVILQLRDSGFTVCAIVTDNASNEVKGVQLLTSGMFTEGQPIALFRIPCLSHTANLAIQDFIKACFPRTDFFADMRKIYSALPTKLRTDRFFGAPTLIETRWYCLRDFCTFISRRYHEIDEVLHPQLGQIPSPAHIALRTYCFDQLAPCLHTLCGFIEWTELENATLSMAWRKIVEAFGLFNSLICEGNELALIFRQSFEHRLSKTACLPQVILSHLVTKEGLAWYRSLPSGDPKQRMQTKESLNDLSRSFRQYFRILLGCSVALLDATWYYYLEHAQFRDDDSTISFWTRTRARLVILDGFSDPCSLGPLGEMGMILARLPCSEASVERVFSHMRHMLGDRAQTMHGDLLEARLTIKLNVSPNETAEQFCSAVDQFIQETGDLRDTQDRSHAERVPVPLTQAPTLGRWTSPRLEAVIHGQLGPRADKKKAAT
jgi:hypothetical protein